MGLEVSALNKRFGATVALDNVSFRLPDRGICGFVGPNGAGKTTALRLLAGLDIPDSGDAFLDGMSIIDYPEKARRRIGYMPDSLPDSSDIKVWEFLDFYARAFDLAGEDKKRRIAEVTKFTSLGEMSEKYLGELSKGMKQRVSLARLMIHDPAVMLLDEPAAGLDPRARMELRDNLRLLAAKGKSIFLSSHILSELEDLVSGVVIIEKGRIVSSGELSALAAGSQPAETERLILTAAPGTDLDAWCEILKGFSFVRKASGSGIRELDLEIDRETFSQAVTELVRRDFPLAALRRPHLSAGLEELFIASTTGEVQ